MLRVRIVIVILLFTNVKLFSQRRNPLTFSFHQGFDKSELLLTNTYYRLSNSDSVMFETMKFYISSVEILNSNKVVWKEESGFHLIDASDLNSLNVTFVLPDNIVFNQIRFNVGIDSITNISGAIGGDLDPTRGMYWTWQNGYINFKLEGKSNLCNTRNSEFQFHLGGYQYPFNTLQTVILNTSSSDKIDITVDIKKFIDRIDLERQNHIMSPGPQAVLLSDYLPGMFFIQEK